MRPEGNHGGFAPPPAKSISTPENIMIARLEGNHGGFALSSTLFPHFLGRLAATIVRLQLEFAKKQAWPGFRVWKQSISALKKTPITTQREIFTTSFNGKKHPFMATVKSSRCACTIYLFNILLGSELVNTLGTPLGKLLEGPKAAHCAPLRYARAYFLRFKSMT